MSKESIKYEIVKELEQHNDYVFGGTLARELGYRLKHKESVIERRARELVNEGVIEKTFTQVDGKGPHVVQYRIKKSVKVDRVSGNLQLAF